MNVGKHDEMVYIYKHTPTDRFACTAVDPQGGVHLRYSTLLPHNAAFYDNSELCKADLLDSIDSNGDRYARENFLEFTLCTYRIELHAYISKFEHIKDDATS